MRMLALVGMFYMFALCNTACRTTKDQSGSKLATVKLGNLAGDLDYDTLDYLLNGKTKYKFTITKTNTAFKETVEPGNYDQYLYARKGDKIVAASDFAPCNKQEARYVMIKPGENLMKIDICTSSEVVLTTQPLKGGDIEIQPVVKTGFYMGRNTLNCFVDKNLSFSSVFIQVDSDAPQKYFELKKEILREKTNDGIHLNYITTDFMGFFLADLRISMSGDVVSKATLSIVQVDNNEKPLANTKPVIQDMVFTECRIQF